MSTVIVTVKSSTIIGAEAIPVSVEVALSNGIVGYSMIGLPDLAVREAKERVHSAIQSAGFEFPRKHITVNLAPAELKKSGAGFDLPIAIGILLASEQIPREGIDECLVCGELALDGSVSGVRGEVALALLAKKQGLKVLGHVTETEARACGVENIELKSLDQLCLGLKTLQEQTPHSTENLLDTSNENKLDYADVVDQEAAKHALVIAAAGQHGLLMMGPPGSGKSMLAKRFPQILPKLSEEERLETMILHSIAGEDTSDVVKGIRPFRAPHHSITSVGLVGGGSPIKPGEISLAHNGVLFFDELPEFQNVALQSLRQPMENGTVNIVRADGRYTFPARFQFIAAANPCPCGYLGDPDHNCSCREYQIEQYQSKIGGPLLDRIDLCVPVMRPDAHKVVEGQKGMSTAQMRDEVYRAREFASWRCEHTGHSSENQPMSSELTQKAAVLLERMGRNLALGGRGITRVARVARTIADLNEEELIGTDDIAEAAAYRVSIGSMVG